MQRHHNNDKICQLRWMMKRSSEAYADVLTLKATLGFNLGLGHFLENHFPDTFFQKRHFRKSHAKTTLSQRF